ncbi:MAG: hypothetical protein ACK515_21520 [bacterium]|jgi:hypothetical protein|nr:hypothetical protein [Betaproteobacteria bacterium]
MRRPVHALPGLFIGLLLGASLPAAVVHAATAAGNPKSTGIICWTDKNGRQVGCGYTVPPEYANNPTRELNTRGITVKKSDAALTGDALRAKQEEEARRKVDEQERAAQRKRDEALLNSYTSEREIDARRDRDLAQVDLSIVGLETHLRQIRASEQELLRRLEGFSKAGKPPPAQLTEDVARVAAETAEIERLISQRRNEQVALRAKYGELRMRYLELTQREAKPK